MDEKVRTIVIDSSPEAVRLMLTPKKNGEGRESAAGEHSGSSGGVNMILDELLRELPVKKKRAPAKKKAVAVAKQAKPKATVGKKRSATAPAKGPPKKKAAKKESSSEDSSTDWPDDDEEAEEEESEESEGTEGESSDDEDEESDEEENAGDEKRVVRFMKAICNGTKVINLAQCRKCQTEQKAIPKLVSAVGGDDELLLHVVQCGKCLDGNELFQQTVQRYFRPEGKQSVARKLEFGEKEKDVGQKKKKKRYVAESDDYKLASGRFIIQIGQCQQCVGRQRKMNPKIFMSKGTKGGKSLAFSQCLQCISGNKACQNAFWKTWSIFAQKGNANAFGGSDRQGTSSQKMKSKKW